MKKVLKYLTAMLIVLAIAVPSLGVCSSAAMTAATKSFYLKINGIDGECYESAHNKWINVLEFSHASTQEEQYANPNTAGIGKFEPFVFKHIVDKSTPRLQEYCMKGSRISTCEFHACASIAGKQEVVYKIKFEEAKVISAEVKSEKMEDGTVQLIETVKLVANKQTWTNTSIGLDNSVGGSTEGNYDQTKRASMFDSSANILTAVLALVAFLAVAAVIVLLIARKKSKKAQ